jgi:hypothetical protein
VLPDRGLLPVAPGRVEVSEGTYSFVPESNLNALSLAIGPFEKRSLEIDDVEYNLYLKPEHDYFSGFFTEIGDTIPDLITEAKDEYEMEELDLYYPFKRINLVEVPVQFHVYERPQTQLTETIQPEMILMPEKGAGLNSMDFARYQFYEDRRKRRGDESSTPREIEVRQFRRFLRMTFFFNFPRTRPISDSRQRGPENLITFGGVEYDNNPYCVFPLYFNYMTGISSKEFPLFNSMLEIYLKEGFTVSGRQSFIGGMSDNEKANMALRDNTMEEIFTDWDNTVTSSLVSQAGSFIFLALKNKVGLYDFDDFLYYYLEEHAFREITFEQFAADFHNEFDVEVAPYFETINTRGKIPSFITSTPRYILTRDAIGEVYLVRFDVRNTGQVKGILDVSFRMAGSFGPGGATEEQRIYEVEPGETREIQITLYEQPRVMTTNTLISGNIPSAYMTFLRSAEEVRNIDMEEYNRVAEKDLTLSVPGEIVVDNEDPGFRHVSVSKESKLKQYIDSRKPHSDTVFYTSVSPFEIPVRWTPVAHSAFYGESVRSALVTRSGDGSNYASWSTVLPSAGFYDVYVYIPMSAMFGRPQRGRGGGPGSPGAQGQPIQRQQGGMGRGPSFADEGYTYHYLISSNEGVDEVEFTLRNIEDGWNRVGAFHFPADSARIELSNRTNGQRVFADAVKWVKR